MMGRTKAECEFSDLILKRLLLLFATCIIFGFVFFRKDLADETSLMSPSE